MLSEYQATCCLKHYVYNYNSPKCGGISPQVTLHVTTPHKIDFLFFLLDLFDIVTEMITKV